VGPVSAVVDVSRRGFNNPDWFPSHGPLSSKTCSIRVLVTTGLGVD
jgi:hypothetical protein